MSSIMNDLEKIQVATSHILADWLRQIFTVVFLLCVVLQKDWKLALVSLTVLPFVLVPTLRIGTPHPPDHPTRAGRCRRTEPDPAGNPQRPQVVKSFGAEDLESNRFAGRGEPDAKPPTCATWRSRRSPRR